MRVKIFHSVLRAYPGSQIRELVDFASKGVNTKGIGVFVRLSSRGTHGFFNPHERPPRILLNLVRPTKDKVSILENDRQIFGDAEHNLALMAHEFGHLRQFRKGNRISYWRHSHHLVAIPKRKRIYSEKQADKFAYDKVTEWRSLQAQLNPIVIRK